MVAAIPGGVASAESFDASSRSGLAPAQGDYPFRDVSLPVEERLDNLVGRMTLDEKIFTLTSGFDYHGCPRLGVPDVRCADGPLGIASWGLRGRAVAFPATLSLAASWDRDLAREMGEAFAREWRSRGLDVFYGPGVNLSRSPKSSRNFEYFGEDPYLTSEIAVPFTRAVQDGGVIAVVKHFAGNEQEFDRYLTDTRADERTLRELYLRPFEEVIRRGDAKAVMMAYNLLNGDYCAQNKWLIDLLRDEWGFRGTVMSDWGATHACKESLDAGLDMELGTYDHLTKEKIRPLLESGQLSERQIDEAVKNIYRPVMELGIFERIGTPDTALTLYSPRNAELASRAAAEGTVLLRNRGNILPLSRNVRRIAIIGPNAAPAMVADRIFNVNHVVHGGGGSSKVHPFTLTSDLQGIIDEFPQAEVTYSEGVSNAYLQRLFDRAGVVNFIEGTDYIDLKGVPDTAVTRWETVITPDRDGCINLFVRAQGGWSMEIDGRMAEDRLSAPGFSDGMVSVEGRKGVPVKVALAYRANNANPREMRFGWDYADGLDFSEALRVARDADVVVFSGGFDSALEFEGTDRSYELPFGQAELISALADVNPNLVVVLRGGGGMATESWEAKVPAMLFLGYPGQDGGHALARVLSGKVNPSGKLPFTWERRWEDCPAYGNYDENRDKRTVTYAEGIFGGYRGFDAKGTEPLFPFGHGLSYSSFEYSGLDVLPVRDARQTYDVTFTVTNTSALPGKEVAQVYVSDLKSSEPRPVRELKGFDKVELAPGESRLITVRLTPDDLKYFSAKKGKWLVEPGEFEVSVGPSSRSLPLSKTFKVK